jgi:hypothetical protein
MAQEIVFYHSAMTGAPSGTLNAVGALLAVLDGCLVNGFNINTVSTLSQSAGTATATTSGTNGFAVNDWVEISGASPAAYNGRFKVLSKPATNQFTFAIDSGTSSPASGTMSSKYPAAGWTKTAAGTNNAAYQAGAGSLGLWMQVEDNNPYADSNVGTRTRQCQGWTALDTATVLGTQVNIHKATGGWMVIADAKTVYAFFGPLGGTVKSFHFGEFAPFYGADAFSAFHSGGRTILGSNYISDDLTGTIIATDFCASSFPGVSQVGQSAVETGSGLYNLRGISQVGASVTGGAVMMPGSSARFVSAGSYYVWVSQNLSIPSLADSSIPIVPIFNWESAAGVYTLRGRFRGMYWPMGKLGSGFTNGYQRLDSALVDGVTQSVIQMTFALSGLRQLVFQVDGAWS